MPIKTDSRRQQRRDKEMGLIVTLVRIVQVGRAKVEEERRRGPGEARPDDDEGRHPSGLVLPDDASTEGTSSRS